MHELVPARLRINLEQWVISERLERARHMPGSSGYAHLSIAAIGVRCGSTDHSHFTRRFRAAYGTTPSARRPRRAEEAEVIVDVEVSGERQTGAVADGVSDRSSVRPSPRSRPLPVRDGPAPRRPGRTRP
ncbi:helix-turn-helix domain-containing protein [Streptomyces sp. NPDC012389]|uniref:helix-turn-helix domain-containing protein n=1 Tax=Streptomyces sp. NPDC012389 TaxID=3364830 RepID=UPI0036E5E903